MQLFETSDQAIKELETSFAIFNDENASKAAKLLAFATAMQAEASLQVSGAHKGNNIRQWEIAHDAAIELRKVFMAAKREAIAIAEKARQEAYSKAMSEIKSAKPFGRK